MGRRTDVALSWKTTRRPPFHYVSKVSIDIILLDSPLILFSLVAPSKPPSLLFLLPSASKGHVTVERIDAGISESFRLRLLQATLAGECSAYYNQPGDDLSG